MVLIDSHWLRDRRLVSSTSIVLKGLPDERAAFNNL
jgi:hypothetical protein